MNKEQILNLHPFFKVDCVDIFFWDTVQKINRHGTPQQRLLVIASPGVFLFEKKPINGFRFSRAIGFAEMRKICENGKTLSIEGETNILQIISQKMKEILIYTTIIQNSLFDPVELEISEEMSNAITEDDFVYDTDNQLSVRFLSFSIQNLQISDPTVIAHVANQLETHNSFIFTEDFLKFKYCEALVKSIAFDQMLETLVISGINFGPFAKHLLLILARNQTLKRLIFNGIIFQGESNELMPFFLNKNVVSPINEIVFDHCESSSNKFTNVVLAFSRFQCRITSIVAKDCLFSNETFRALFLVVFQSLSFPHLAEFAVIGESNPEVIQKFSLKITNKKKSKIPRSFRHLRLDSIHINSSQLIAAIAQMNSLITSLSCFGSTFKQPLQLASNSFGRLRKLDLSNSWVTPESLTSLMETISHADPSISHLVLDHLHLTEAGFNKFFQSVSALSAHSIECLSWENNPVKNVSLSLFFGFLSCMPNITDLSLSNSLWSCKEAASKLSQYISKNSIERLILRGNGFTAFGDLLIPVLNALLNSESICSLDVSGQCLNDNCIGIIANLLCGKVTSISFDGQNPSKAEPLLECLENIISQNVTYAIWPEQNVKSAILKYPIMKRGEILRQFEQLKTSFQDKFNKADESNPLDDESSTIIKPSTVPHQHHFSSEELVSNIPKIDFEVLEKVEDDLTDLLAESMDQQESSTSLSISIRDVCKYNNMQYFL